MSAKSISNIFNISAFSIILGIDLSTNLNENFRNISTYSSIILMVATISYLLIQFNNDNYIIEEQIRYLDWIITTPLLLFTFWEYARVTTGCVSISSLIRLITLDLIMIVLGYLGTFVFPQHKEAFYLLSFIVLFLLFEEISKIVNILRCNDIPYGFIPWLFFIPWILYGVFSYLPYSPTRSILLNLLDFISKGVYAIALLELAKNISPCLKKFKCTITDISC